MKIAQVLRETLTLILAGGQGERLYPLTRDRAKPAVPFAGHYRIIDFTLSNCESRSLANLRTSPTTFFLSITSCAVSS